MLLSKAMSGIDRPPGVLQRGETWAPLLRPLLRKADYFCSVEQAHSGRVLRTRTCIHWEYWLGSSIAGVICLVYAQRGSTPAFSAIAEIVIGTVIGLSLLIGLAMAIGDWKITLPDRGPGTVQFRVLGLLLVSQTLGDRPMLAIHPCSLHRYKRADWHGMVLVLHGSEASVVIAAFAKGDATTRFAPLVSELGAEPPATGARILANH